MISTLISEATVCDFKEALEVKKPKSWLNGVFASLQTQLEELSSLVLKIPIM